MVDNETFRKMALSFEEVTELPHFAKTSFRINNKIFATLDEKTGKAVVKLTEVEQSVFCGYGKSVVYPTNGVWGKQGWTVIELSAANSDLLMDALNTSYCNVAPARLTEGKRF